MLLDTPVVNLGWQASPFSLPDADGKLYCLQALQGENGLLIAFICNHCPYVKAIGHRLAEDANHLRDNGINVVAINSNNFKAYPADSPPKMKEFSVQYGLTFPYLVDEDQSVAKAYGAVCTPDFFGFNNRGELQYRGRLDDARMNDDSNRVPELLNAMRLISQTGFGPEEQTASMGCSIKWS